MQNGSMSTALFLTLVLGACRASPSREPESAPSSTAQASLPEPATAASEQAPSASTPDDAALKVPQ